MPLNPAMWTLTLAELGLWAALSILFWKKKLYQRFPTMGNYLALRTISTPVLLAILYIQTLPWGRLWYGAYFFGYWAVYIASAVLLLLISIEVFRSALVGFSGLQRFGTVIFRWAAIASVIISLTTVSYANANVLLIPAIALQFMRSVSIIELCLLAFLCLSMNALKLSPRDRCFGIALGFGIFSAGDFISGALQNLMGTLTDPVQFVGEGAILLTLGVWSVYALLPEPERKPVVVAANSTIYRWNEIASALGHQGTNIAVPQPANSFFLTDVEKVVEKVLTRTLQESSSNS